MSFQKLRNLLPFVIGFPKSYKMLKSNDFMWCLNIDLVRYRKTRHSGSVTVDLGSRY